jgi:hypothetical protein
MIDEIDVIIATDESRRSWHGTGPVRKYNIIYRKENGMERGDLNPITEIHGENVPAQR